MMNPDLFLSFPPLASPLGFYAVLPDAAWVERMVAAGVNTVQLRVKHLCGAALRAEIARCVAAVRGTPTQLFINDHWREAVDEGAYGVHLGQEDMGNADLAAIAAAGLRLGISTHSDAELARALAVHPSYVACGAIFPTTTKLMPTAPQGVERLCRYVAAAGDTPTVAIGGITLDNAQEVLASGVSSLAVVRALTESACPEKTVRAFCQLFSK